MREKLIEDLAVIDFLLKTSAAREPDVGLLLRGHKQSYFYLDSFKSLIAEFRQKLFLYLLDYTKEVMPSPVIFLLLLV